MARRPTAEETQAALEAFLASLETRGPTPLELAQQAYAARIAEEQAEAARIAEAEAAAQAAAQAEADRLAEEAAQAQAEAEAAQAAAEAQATVVAQQAAAEAAQEAQEAQAAAAQADAIANPPYDTDIYQKRDGYWYYRDEDGKEIDIGTRDEDRAAGMLDKYEEVVNEDLTPLTDTSAYVGEDGEPKEGYKI
jgi:hypothetical protein